MYRLCVALIGENNRHNCVIVLVSDIQVDRLYTWRFVIVITEGPKSRRLNVMISESLIERTARTAQTRGMTVSALVREALERECERSHEEAIAQAAEALAPLYTSDENLAAFLALDGEDFA